MAGTTEAHVHTARDANRGEKTIKPGLNYVANVDGKAQTGFVDGQGVFRGPHLPVTLTGPLPRVAVILGPVAFQHGKDGALGTLRHEMKHAEHFQAMIDWLAKWRQDMARQGVTKLDDTAARKRFDLWVDRHKSMGKTERSLLLGERSSNHANTELLAYVEGFVNIFHLRQTAVSVAVAYDYPPALYQLRRAGEEYRHADTEVKAMALDRLREYVKTVLTPQERTALRTWLTFLADNARAPAKSPPADLAAAAKLLHHDFKPVLPFLEKALALVP